MNTTSTTTTTSSTTKEAKIFNNQWILKQKVSSGQDQNTKDLVAIQLQKEDTQQIKALDREVHILQRLKDVDHVPRLIWSGHDSNFNVMIINLLGQDLAHYIKNHKQLSVQTVSMIADQLLQTLESIHQKSIVHRDLKPENILMGIDAQCWKVYLIDFGISKVYRDHNGRHISYKENKPFIGTTRYASIAAHLGHELSRKDDLESLGYVLIFLLKGCLPWQNLQDVSDADKTKRVGEIKQKTKNEVLCQDLPPQFIKYFQYSKQLQFKQDPDYIYLRNLFAKIAENQKFQLNDREFDWTSTENNDQLEKEKNNLIPQRQKSRQLSNIDAANVEQYLKLPGGPGQRKDGRHLSLTPSMASATPSALGSRQNMYIPSYGGTSNYSRDSQNEESQQQNSVFDEQDEFNYGQYMEETPQNIQSLSQLYKDLNMVSNLTQKTPFNS